MKPQRKITRSKRKLFFFAAIVLALVIGCSVWRQYVNAIPDVKIPTTKMPSPNAYDFYVKAIAAAVPANPPVDQIHDSKVTPEAQWKTVYPTAKKEAWLRQNAKSLNLLREGFKYPCRVPLLPVKTASRFPNLAKFREMARTLSIESHARSERGNWSGAVESSLDTLRLGHDLAQGGTLIDYLVGAAIDAIGRRELWKNLPHLNAMESKAAARRLEKIIQSRASYADVMRGEKQFGQTNLLEQMRSNKLHTGDEFADDETQATNQKQWAERWQIFVMPRRKIFNNYTAYMDALIANAEKPYATKAAAPPIPNDSYNQALAPVYNRSRWNYARDNSGNALFLVSLALRAYNLEHKTYPKNLQELVPNYLQKIPADPYGGGENLHYKISGREYSLYSIGPDGIDNRGRAIEDAKFSKKERRRFVILPDSKGDIVASVNYP